MFKRYSLRFKVFCEISISSAKKICALQQKMLASRFRTLQNLQATVFKSTVKFLKSKAIGYVANVTEIILFLLSLLIEFNFPEPLL